MRNFIHVNAKTIDEAVLFLRRYGNRAAVIAGGTDLLGKMKDEIMPTYPEAIINIKTIPGLEVIEERDDRLTIGALTRLEDIAANGTIKDRYLALSQAAHRTASPHIREMGTLGGNICQDIRCWYYRNPQNRFPCLRKGGGRCYAIKGDNRYHSIFGGSVEEGCYAVHPSDTAPALIVLDARIKTSKRTVNAQDFFLVNIGRTTVLDPDEIVIQIDVPLSSAEGRSSFLKFAIRKSLDFPIVNCAAMIQTSRGVVSFAKICLNAVYVKPYRAHEAEAYILGKQINDSNAERAAEAAVSRAKPLTRNRYMVQISKTLVKRAIMDCG